MIVSLTKRVLDTVEKKVEKSEKLYEDARERARALRPEAPEPPYAGVKDKDKLKVYEEWLSSGSEEWRRAYNEALALDVGRWGKNDARVQAIKDADEKLLARITKSQDATVKELKRQVDIFLQTDFVYQKDKSGYFVPNFGFIQKELRNLFYKPMQTLDTERQVEIENYIDLRAGDLPQKVSSYTAKYSLSCGITTPQTGTDSGEKTTIKQGKRKGQEISIPCNYTIYYFIPAVDGNNHETTEERHTTATPKKYVTTVDRISKKAFKGGLVRPLDADSSDLWDVRLESHRSKSEVIARVAIDYKKIMESENISDLPKLTDDDYDVHDAIISELNAGNYVFTKTMLYRVMTGKMKVKDLEIPADADRVIEDALLKFKGTMQLEYSGEDKDGNIIEIKLDEPLVTYIRGKGYLNGKYMEDLIILPRDDRFAPPLYKWAQFNRNEIDTRDVTLLDVKGLNNGRESRVIKMCLYRRLISMRNSFERKYHSKKELPNNQRSIRYDFIYSALSLEDPDKNKRRLVKSKIDRCMSYWKDKGFIADYLHKRDNSGTYYAVEVSFLLPKKK